MKRKFRLNTVSGIILCHMAISNLNKSLYLKMALDTGATYTMIPYEAAATIGIDPTKAKKTIEIIMGNGTILAPIVRLPVVCAFGFQVNDLDVICHDLPSESSVEGLLGLNFIKKFNLFLKFKDNLLEISK